MKFDYETALPLRDKNGRCIKVRQGKSDYISVSGSAQMLQSSCTAAKFSVSEKVCITGLTWKMVMEMIIEYASCYNCDSTTD